MRRMERSYMNKKEYNKKKKECQDLLDDFGFADKDVAGTNAVATATFFRFLLLSTIFPPLYH